MNEMNIFHMKKNAAQVCKIAVNSVISACNSKRLYGTEKVLKKYF